MVPGPLTMQRSCHADVAMAACTFLDEVHLFLHPANCGLCSSRLLDTDGMCHHINNSLQICCRFRSAEIFANVFRLVQNIFSLCSF